MAFLAVTLVSLLLMPAFVSPALAEDLPACALTGSMTMMIGGRPALRLSDVVDCPAGSYEIINSVRIDGQPMVHFKSGQFGKFRCIPDPAMTVTAEDKTASTAGPFDCKEGE